MTAPTRRAIDWASRRAWPAGAIKKNSALCHLNLEKNGSTKGGKSIAGRAGQPALVSLDLSDNGFGRRVASLLRGLLKQDTLTYLDLSDPTGNNLTTTTYLGGASR